MGAVACANHVATVSAANMDNLRAVPGTLDFPVSNLRKGTIHTSYDAVAPDLYIWDGETWISYAQDSGLFAKILNESLANPLKEEAVCKCRCTKRRQMIHVTVGEPDWEPSVEDLNALTEVFSAASIDPEGSVVVTRTGVSVKVVDLQEGDQLVVARLHVDQSQAAGLTSEQ